MEQFCDDNLLVWMILSLSNDASPKFLETNNFCRSTRSLRQSSTLFVILYIWVSNRIRGQRTSKNITLTCIAVIWRNFVSFFRTWRCYWEVEFIMKRSLNYFYQIILRNLRLRYVKTHNLLKYYNNKIRWFMATQINLFTVDETTRITVNYLTCTNSIYVKFDHRCICSLLSW